MNKKSTASTSSSHEQKYHRQPQLVQKKNGDQEPQAFDEKTSRLVSFESESNDINYLAEVFIKRFKRKLEMQHLESVRNHH